MSRKIIPQLFEQDVTVAPMGADENLSFFDPPASDSQALTQVFEKLEGFKYELEKSKKSEQLRVEQVQTHLTKLENRFNQMIQEFNEKLTGLVNRYRDFKNAEAKIESVIDRHNVIVQNFELRIAQAQRVVENQALQLGKQTEIIEDLKRQLERLKKL